MKLGLDIGYSGAKMALPMEKILLAEKLGFDSIWSAEAYGSDAITPLVYIGALTKKLRLATGIAQLAARTPTNLAMTAQTADALVGEGRMVIGLGVSNPQVVEGWYGQPWGKPAERIRDYVAIMRKVWRREEPLRHGGAEIRIPYDGPGATGRAKPLKSILHGDPNIPVMLGANTPGNLRLTGEITDGLVAMHTTPHNLPGKIKYIEEGLAKRADGKTLKDFEIVANVGVIVTDDIKGAMAEARKVTALYVGGMGSRDQNFHNQAMVGRDFGAEAERIQELYLAGRKEEAEAAVPEDYLDQGALYGPPARIRERFPAWRDAGFTVLRLTNVDETAMKLMAQIAG
ncbi:LLM class F420-dependent oxidoreductase [Novosphingobium sp. G106]|uniref:LLM class F420-dependent oxidoreductase n=1 Tax=Novosphingobium sp. G106 TaxID=2849500 RepID=UPI001C2D02FE|nr:LLM class F420-dependent oxidoreductase [Novosphingobium sp. G106]MBV1691264.1 LLM class F420-dependent oxidoreductase [Novosphingobium sp. G106]